MEPGTLLKPNVSEELAIALARRLYGLEVTEIKRMVSFDDQNFHIKVAKQYQNPYISRLSDDGYTLKITNTLKSSIPDHFDSMHSTMMHLSSKKLRTPVPVRNLDGYTWKLEKVPLLNEDDGFSGPRLCGIHLLTFLPGVPISTLEYTKDLLYQWGLLLAKYHNAVEDFNHPALRDKSIFWNLKHIPEIRKYMEGMEGQREKIVLSVLNRFESEIENNLDRLPKGLIHGDFNENNILVQSKTSASNETVFSVDGILDFEDVHYGTFVWDIGLMLAYTLLDCETMDPLEGAGHALAGYLSLRTLCDLELSLLKMCIECRLCQSLVLCAYSYRTDPSNVYLLTSAKTGWSRLELMCNINNEDLLHKWKEVQRNNI